MLKSQVCLEDLQTSILSSSWWSPRPRRSLRPPSALKGSCQIDSDDERIPRYLRRERKSTRDYWTENTFSLESHHPLAKRALLTISKKSPPMLKKIESPHFLHFSKNDLKIHWVQEYRTETRELNYLTFFFAQMHESWPFYRKKGFCILIEGFFSLLSIQMHHLHICIAKLMQYFSKKKKFFKVLSLYLPNSLQKTDTFPPKVWKSSFIGTFSRRTTMAKSWWRRRTSWLLTSRIFI